MELGQHHIALNVKNLEISRDFYIKLGFIVDAHFSNPQRKYLIMRHALLVIGLYEGVIPRNTITFTPQDIRGLQKELKLNGIPFVLEANEETQGPAHFLLVDPDGNPLFFEQH